MSLELSSLIFQTDTSKLKEAKTAIDDLAVSMRGLDKATTEGTKGAVETVKISAELVKAKRDLVKAEDSLANATANAANNAKKRGQAEQAATQATEESTSKLSAAEKVHERIATKVELLRSGFINLTNESINLGKGFTTSQAAALANLKVLSASGDLIKEVAQEFKNLNAFSSAKPFDPTVAGLERLRKETQELIMVNEYMAKGFGLTKDQITALARDSEALRQQFNQMGKSESDLSAALNKLEKDTVEAAQAFNKLKNAATEADKIAKEQAKALQTQANSLRESFNQVVQIHTWKQQHEEKLYQQEMQDLREYFTAQNITNEAIERSQKESFDNRVYYHKLKQQQDRQNYEQDMKQLRDYYQQMQEVSMQAERELAKIDQRIAKEKAQTNYLNQGATRSTANVAADMQIRGVPQNVIDSFIKEATAKEKAARASQDHANAIRNVQAAEERLFGTMQHLNDGVSQNATLNERAALALGSYERNLRLAGIAGEEAATKIKAFKTAQEQVSKMEQQRNVNQLSRSLTPQISDVAVSLYGGMSPMTVLMQQGLQVRDLIAQSRVETDKLAEAFKKAGSDMVGSIVGTANAMGSLFIGTIITAGEAITNGLIAPFKRLYELAVTGKDFLFFKYLDKDIQTANVALGNFSSVWQGFLAATSATVRVLGSIGAVIGGSVLISYLQTSNAIDKMNEALLLNGARLGLSKDEAIALSQQFAGFGSSANEVKSFFAELAKVGFTTKENLDLVTKSSIKLAEITSLSLADIAKKYGDLSKDPVEALRKLASETGNVTLKQIEYIKSLVEVGDKTTAVSEASVIMAGAFDKAATKIKEDMSPLKILFVEIKGLISDVSTELSSWTGKGSVIGAILNDFSRLFSNIRTGRAMKAEQARFESISSPTKEQIAEHEHLVAVIAKERAANYDLYNGIKSGIDAASTAQTKAEAEAVIAAKKYSDAVEGLQNKTLSRAEFIAEKVKDIQKKAEASLLPEDLKAAQSKFGKEWDNAHQTKKTDADKEAAKVQTWYNQTIKEFHALQIEATAANDKGILPIELTTKAYIKLQKTLEDPKWGKLKREDQEATLKEWEKTSAIEVQNLLYRKQEDALKKLQTVWDNFAKLNLKYDEEIKAANEELNFQTSILFKSETQIKKMTREYEEQKNIAKINAEYEKERLNLLLEYNQAIKDVDPLTANILQTDYLNRQAEIEKKSQEKVLIERQKTNLKTVQDFEKKWRDIQDGISDALYTSLTKGGKEGAKQFRKFMEEQLKKEFVLPAIKAVVNLVTESGLSLVGAGISALMGSSASSGSSGSASSLGNIAGLASNARSAYGLYTGGQAAYTAYTADLALTSAEASTAALQYLYSGDWGTALGLYLKGLISPASTTAAPAAATATTGSTASMGLGTALGYMAAIAVAFNLLTESKTRYLDTSITGTLGPEGLTNGMIGDRYKYTGNLLDAGGTDLEWRPLTSNQAEYDAFYMNMRFGNYRNNATALQSAGYLGDNIDPYTLQQVPFTQEQIDTAFSKLVEDTYALDTRINRTGSGETVATELEQGGTLKLAFETIYKSAKDSLQKTADLFGDKSLGALLENYVSQINIQTSGSLADAIGQYAEGLISGMGAAWLPAVETLRQTTETDGKKITETWSAAFNRLVNESLAVNSILKVMGTSMQEVFGRDNTNNILTMSNSLVKIFGSIDNLNNSFNAYYSNFYSTAEKTARQWEQVDAVFASLNISAPRTREGFRGIVEGLDLNTSKGQSAFKVLMDVQAAFAALTPVTEEVVAVITKLNHLSADYDEYFSKYYSAEDNRVRNIQKITQTLNNAGFSLTTDQVAKATTQQFKDLVAYFYSMGEAGITAVNALMEVQGAFYALNEAVDTVTKRVNSEIGNQAQEKALEDYSNALQGYTTETANALQTQLNSQKQLADDYKKIAEDMRKYRSTLQVSDTNPQGILDRYSIAKAKFSSTSALAATGDITAMSGLTSVAQDFLGLSKATAGSKGQYAVDYAKVLAALDVTEVKAQSEADRLQASVDSISSNAASATKSLLSIDTAMKALLDAVKASAGIGAGATSATVDAINKAGLGSTWVDTSTGKPATSTTTTADKMYVSSRGAVITYTPTGLGKLTSSAGSYTHDQIIAAAQAAQAGGNLRGIYNWAWDNGITLSELDAILGMPGNTAASWAIANGLPTFASGGRYGGGVALVGEEGPELINFRNPGQVYNASQTRGILNADNSELLNALINEVSLLRAETRATAIHSAKTSKILDRAIGKDDSLNVSVVA